MKLICEKVYRSFLEEKLKPYLHLPVILVQKEISYDQPAIYFDMDHLSILLELLEKMQPTQHALAGEKNQRWYPLKCNDILFIEGYSRDTFAYTAKETYRILQRISELEEKWKDQAFIRINRSTLVNTTHIQYILPSLSSKLILHLSNDMEVEVSRSYLRSFKTALRMKVKS